MNVAILEGLISELLGIKNLLVVIDSDGVVCELETGAISKPEFHGEWANIESEGWHVHLNMNSVFGVQFVEAEDYKHESIPKLYYLRLSNAENKTIIRFYFPNPWRDDRRKPTTFQPEKLSFFKAFRDRYVGREGIIFDFVPRPGSLKE